MKKLMAPAVVVLLATSVAGCSTIRGWWHDDKPAPRPAPAAAVLAPPPAPAAPAPVPPPPPPPPPAAAVAPPPPVVAPPPAVTAAAAYCVEAGGTVVGSLIYQAGDARPACQVGSSDWDLEDFRRYDVAARLRANAS
ncbi:hypothetical protein [Neomegalonema sp.]|uniref:hypothetical protein n=1 Tax=Neomegalonema sp. TaxID=2039713 RepID=UPI0026184A4C|nr:hypothetical protein [Neomegalonema sp.]MDD2868035.1 hypothetical protein [Neomegalonema sp.]